MGESIREVNCSARLVLPRGMMFHISAAVSGLRHTMPISFASRVRIPTDVMVSQLGGESVLLNLKTESYFGLDDVGTCMWEKLRESASISEAYDQLLAEYDVDAETLRTDLADFLENLERHGLIQIDSAEVA